MLPRKPHMDPPPPSVVASDDPAPLDCPACGYDLRGFSNARCPECGSTFDVEQLRAGAARVNEPTWLDAADVYQPHQLLIRSLFELMWGAVNSSARLARVSVIAPTSTAIAMVLLGELWNFILCAAVMAIGIALQTTTSPAASVRTAILLWSPVLMLIRWAMYTGLVWPALDARLLRVVGVPLKARARVPAYWLPSLGLWCSLPLALGAAAVPDYVLPLAWVAPTLTSTAAMLGIVRVAGRRLTQVGVFAAACCILGACAAAVTASRLLPDRLEPPIWIFVR